MSQLCRNRYPLLRCSEFGTRNLPPTVICSVGLEDQQQGQRGRGQGEWQGCAQHSALKHDDVEMLNFLGSFPIPCLSIRLRH
eukprot:5047610-Amphidinium_carterae.1